MRRRLVLLLALWPAAGLAQEPSAVGQHVTIPTRAVAEGSPGTTVPAVPTSWLGTEGDVLRTPTGAFAASLVLPGSGQAALGLKRWVAYGLLELGLWGLHLDAAGDFRRLRTRYRDLAWESARLPTGPGERVDGDWGYYEKVGQYLRSGAFDEHPTVPGVQPETDPATYNGSVWELALGIFLRGGEVDPDSPEYADAVAYYRGRAAGSDFLWDWTGRLDDLDRYRSVIDDADHQARVRSTALGLVLANHLVSAVDALIVARMRAEDAVRLDSRLITTTGEVRWRVGLRIPIRNR